MSLCQLNKNTNHLSKKLRLESTIDFSRVTHLQLLRHAAVVVPNIIISNLSKAGEPCTPYLCCTPVHWLECDPWIAAVPSYPVLGVNYPEAGDRLRGHSSIGTEVQIRVQYYIHCAHHIALLTTSIYTDCYMSRNRTDPRAPTQSLLQGPPRGGLHRSRCP